MDRFACVLIIVSTASVSSLRVFPMRAETPALYAEDDIHLVFSTDCGRYQTIQSELLAYSAIQVGQKGRMTRIVSGCKAGTMDLAQMRRSVNPNYEVHITPDYSNLTRTDSDSVFDNYPFYNKVLGLRDWLENASPPVKESVIVMFDPDMMLLAPISPNGRLKGQRLHSLTDLQSHGILWGGGKIPTEGVSDLVAEGTIVSQGYTQGVPWARADLKLELSKVMGEDSKANDVIDAADGWTSQDGIMHFSVGMPTAVHISDARKIFKTWAEIVVPTHNLIDKKANTWQADMFAWEMAVAHHGVTQLRMNHLMISNTLVEDGDRGEGFPLIDDWHRDTCNGGPWAEDGNNPRMPYVLHYCQGMPHADPEWSQDDYPTNLTVHKKHVPNNLLECKAPMLVDPPTNLRELDSGKIANSGPTKRVAWMACAYMKGMTAMTLAFKSKYCMPGFNTSRTTEYKVPEQYDVWGKPLQKDEVPFSNEGAKPN